VLPSGDGNPFLHETAGGMLAAMARRAAREEFADYVVEIEGWDWGYSLSLNTENRTSEVPF